MERTTNHGAPSRSRWSGLKQRDADSGVVDHPPTDEQKAAIAEARNVHAAKLAELQILQRSKLAGTSIPPTVTDSTANIATNCGG